MLDKKILSTPLNEKLYEQRKLLKISLDELSEKTNIPVKYLHRIEKGDWDKLPSEVYTRGFLKKYARSVGTNSDQIIKRYEREILQSKDREKKNSYKEGKREFKIKFLNFENFSPRTLQMFLVGIVLVFILGYIGYQFRVVLAKPEIIIEIPETEEIVTSSDNIVLKGKVEKNSDVFLNDRLVAVKVDGAFSETLELLPGLNLFEIKAISRFNRETLVIRRVIYSPQNSF